MSTIAIRFSTALIALALCATAVAQESFSTLEERMTGEEFMETGLHKLSKEELAALNEWIRARSLTDQEVAELNKRRAAGTTASAVGDRRGFEDGPDDTSIESRINGSFSGWTGETVFELQNGMVWEQVRPGTFGMPEQENPSVTIRPGAFDAWYLSVDGYNREVLVRRVE
jgi:uncharacterized protein YqgQ